MSAVDLKIIFGHPIIVKVNYQNERSPSRIVNQTSKETAVDARVKIIFN